LENKVSGKEIQLIRKIKRSGARWGGLTPDHQAGVAWKCLPSLNNEGHVTFINYKNYARTLREVAMEKK